MFRTITSIITAIIFFLLACLTLLMLAGRFPIFGGIQSFVVQSGSMEPAIHTGSLIFIKPAAEYNESDIVTRFGPTDRILVTHRIVGKNTSEFGAVTFTTKGDANEEVDLETTSPDRILGKVFLSIPYLGYPVNYAKSPQGFIVLIVIPAAILIYEELRKLKDESLRLWKKRQAAKHSEQQVEKE